MEELAEVLAVDFDDEEGMPKLNPNWRWDDQEQALLSSCSSLIAIVESDGSRIVQFSHFSVKEYLTSDRLASSSGHISLYHIDLQPAHTILAQACLSVLLRSDDRVEESGVRNTSPLAKYAARHWVAHAQDEKTRSSLRKAIQYLFDAGQPYFAAWLKLHNIDPYRRESTFWVLTYKRNRSWGTPLYYAALCGFQNLVEHLIINYPEQVNARGGEYLVPLIAALEGGHFQTAKLLCDHGADPNARGRLELTPLHCAAYEGNFEMAQLLLKCKADANAQGFYGRTPLYWALENRTFGGPNIPVSSLSNVARLLLEHGADVNLRKDDLSTLLHVAAKNGRDEVVHMLLEHVASLGAVDDDRRITFKVESEFVNARDKSGQTPLHNASEGPHSREPNIALSLSNIARLLLEHGADVNVRGVGHSTPLHVAAQNGRDEVAHVLLEHVTNLGAVDDDRQTVVSEYVNARNAEGKTALRLASRGPYDHDPHITLSLSNIARLLLKHGADINAPADDLSAPLHAAVEYGRDEVVHVLLEHVLNLGAVEDDRKTGFQVVSEYVNARGAKGRTLLHLASEGPHSQEPSVALSLSNIARLLLKKGADVNARADDLSTPLHVAAQNGMVAVVHMLLEHVANLGAVDDDGKTTSQVVSEYVNSRNVEGKTPLHLASQGYEGLKTLSLSIVAQLLLKYGAQVNAQGNDHSTPLHVAAQYGRIEVVHVLLMHGVDISAEDDRGRTASQVALDNRQKSSGREKYKPELIMNLLTLQHTSIMPGENM